MTDFRKVTDDLSVAGQLQPEDLQAVTASGFKTVICNRPDNEEAPGQPSIEMMQAEAESLGLVFLALPFGGLPTTEIAHQQGALIDAADKPVLAYCRSGTRSITAWALSQAGQGKSAQIVETARAAGYDLSGLINVL